MKPIISIENLGKCYKIRHAAADAPTNFREVLMDLPRKLLKGGAKTKAEDFWALKDVSFDIMPGERVGIIGRNGAGKSTLLKLLSRITEPTTGKITMRGRVASLLEVGTGFHPELTGRENIFLNGAILGMSRAEVRKKFDEIVDFAGVEKFLDTPVKRYSSGMYVRLGFAVAAHLEPEILVVDEVLAVGDVAFQKKCLGKMEEVSKGQGRTVLFVSHNMAMMAKLCQRALLLKNGVAIFHGSMQKTIDTYYQAEGRVQDFVEKELQNPDEFQFLSICTTDENCREKKDFKHDEAICLFSRVYLPILQTGAELAVSLYDYSKNRIFTIHEPLVSYRPDNEYLNVQIKVLPNFITPGDYSWLMCINVPGDKLYDLQDGVCHFSVFDAGSKFSRYPAGSYGAVRASYSTKKIME